MIVKQFVLRFVLAGLFRLTTTREYVLGSLTIHFEIVITKYQTVFYRTMCLCHFDDLEPSLFSSKTTLVLYGQASRAISIG